MAEKSKSSPFQLADPINKPYLIIRPLSKPSTMASTIVNRAHLHRQTLQILNDNSLHFIPFSLLFLPLTFSASAAAAVQSSGSPLTLLFIETTASSKTLISLLAFTLFVILPTVAGTAFITHSANQAIHHKRLTFSSAVKSLSHSYIPFFSTILAGTLKLILLSLLFTLSAFAATEANKASGLKLDQFFVSIAINTIASYVLQHTILFFLLNWGSAAAISVLESKSRLDPLQKSVNQSTEFRSYSFFITFMISSYVIGSAVIINSVIVQIIGSTTNWVSILLVCVTYLNSSLMILLHAVANTVLYVQYKVARGEETVKTAAEGGVSVEYGFVGSDEVPVQMPKGGFSYVLCVFAIFWIVVVPLYVLLGTTG